MKLSVIIPAYNEEAILRDTVRTLSDALTDMQLRGIFDPNGIMNPGKLINN